MYLPSKHSFKIDVKTGLFQEILIIQLRSTDRKALCGNVCRELAKFVDLDLRLAIQVAYPK